MKVIIKFINDQKKIKVKKMLQYNRNKVDRQRSSLGERHGLASSYLEDLVIRKKLVEEITKKYGEKNRSNTTIHLVPGENYSITSRGGNLVIYKIDGKLVKPEIIVTPSRIKTIVEQGKYRISMNNVSRIQAANVREMVNRFVKEKNNRTEDVI